MQIQWVGTLLTYLSEHQAPFKVTEMREKNRGKNKKKIITFRDHSVEAISNAKNELRLELFSVKRKYL